MYRILVCDDEEEIVSSLTACLTAEGYQVVTARTGWEVLNILSKQHIHLALLGTKLPGLDGLTTVTRLRQMHRREHLHPGNFRPAGDPPDLRN